MKKFKVLIGNGDSYSAGDETASPQFYPKYAKLYPAGDFQKPESKLREDWIKESFHTPVHFEYKKQCKLLSYPNVLASLLKLEVVNLSQSGQANPTTTATTIGYIEDHIRPYYDLEEILVVINLTNFDRLKIPMPEDSKQHSPDSIPNLYNCQSLLLGWPMISHHIPKELINHFQLASDKYLILENIASILSLIKYFEQNSIDYVLTDSNLYRMSRERHADQYKNFLAQLPIIDNDYTFLNQLTPGELQICEFGHYSAKGHRIFASHLEKLIRARFPNKLND